VALAIQEVTSEDQAGAVDAGKRSPRPLCKVFLLVASILNLCFAVRTNTTSTGAAKVGIRGGDPGQQVDGKRAKGCGMEPNNSSPRQALIVVAFIASGDVEDRGCWSVLACTVLVHCYPIGLYAISLHTWNTVMFLLYH
jgi:hypothetical protein